MPCCNSGFGCDVKPLHGLGGPVRSKAPSKGDDFYKKFLDSELKAQLSKYCKPFEKRLRVSRSGWPKLSATSRRPLEGLRAAAALVARWCRHLHLRRRQLRFRGICVRPKVAEKSPRIAAPPPLSRRKEGSHTSPVIFYTIYGYYVNYSYYNILCKLCQLCMLYCLLLLCLLCLLNLLYFCSAPKRSRADPASIEQVIQGKTNPLTTNLSKRHQVLHGERNPCRI